LEGVPVVVFKGGILTRMLYGDLGRRASVDNDLWVREPLTQVALQRLVDAGFSALPGLDPHRALRREGQVALWPEGDDPIGADLHAAPFSRRIFAVSEQILDEHVVPYELHGRLIRTFDKPLSLVHLVAHYVQHRLDPEHLGNLGAAWDQWDLQESEVRRLAVATCSEPALEFALMSAFEQGHATRPVPFATHRRVRSLLRLTDAGRRPGGESSARLLSLVLAAPDRIVRWTYDGVVLDEDEFVARSGKGRSVGQILRRIRDLARRG
jgi:hypothetical protein